MGARARGVAHIGNVEDSRWLEYEMYVVYIRFITVKKQKTLARATSKNASASAARARAVVARRRRRRRRRQKSRRQ
jgi:hypothetical protein